MRNWATAAAKCLKFQDDLSGHNTNEAKLKRVTRAYSGSPSQERALLGEAHRKYSGEMSDGGSQVHPVSAGCGRLLSVAGPWLETLNRSRGNVSVR